MQKTKIIRTATVALSLDYLLKGQLAFLNESYEIVAVSGQDAHLENVASREGVRTVSVVMQRQISPLKDVVSLVRLFLLFKKEKPLMVHSITPKAGLLSMIAAYFAGVPIRIHTFTGLIFPYRKGFSHHLLLFMDKILCRFATHIFPEGEGVKKDLLAFKVTNKPLHIIANGNVNGIDLDYFNPDVVDEHQKEHLKKQLNILSTDFVFVFVGRLVSDKGINELVTAFELLQKERSNIKLLLVGNDEPALDPLEQKTLQTIQTNENIISVGFQKDIRPYLAISAVFVFPSYREGFPNVVMQAGAMNLPSIVTNISGSNEIIIEGVNGIIIPVKNATALAKAMQQIVFDTTLYETLQLQARTRIVSNYEQHKVWEALLAEYKSFEKK